MLPPRTNEPTYCKALARRLFRPTLIPRLGNHPKSLVSSRVSLIKVTLLGWSESVVGLLSLLFLCTSRMTGTRFRSGTLHPLVTCRLLFRLKTQHPLVGRLVGANYVTPLISLKTGPPMSLPWNTPIFPLILVSVMLRGASMTIVFRTGTLRIRSTRTLFAFGGTLTSRKLSLFYCIRKSTRPNVP